MAHDQPFTLSVLAKFHREVIVLDTERIVAEAVDRVCNDLRELRARAEMRQAQIKAIQRRLDG